MEPQNPPTKKPTLGRLLLLLGVQLTIGLAVVLAESCSGTVTTQVDGADVSTNGCDCSCDCTKDALKTAIESCPNSLTEAPSLKGMSFNDKLKNCCEPAKAKDDKLFDADGKATTDTEDCDACDGCPAWTPKNPVPAGCTTPPESPEADTPTVTGSMGNGIANLRVAKDALKGAGALGSSKLSTKAGDSASVAARDILSNNAGATAAESSGNPKREKKPGEAEDAAGSGVPGLGGPLAKSGGSAAGGPGSTTGALSAAGATSSTGDSTARGAGGEATGPTGTTVTTSGGAGGKGGAAGAGLGFGFGGDGGGTEGGGATGEANFGEKAVLPTGGDNPMLSNDPEDYFARTEIADNLFHKVEKKLYEKQSLWMRQNLEAPKK